MLLNIYMVVMTCAIVAVYLYARGLGKQIDRLGEIAENLLAIIKVNDALSRSKNQKDFLKELENEFGKGCVKVEKIKSNKRGKK